MSFIYPLPYFCSDLLGSNVYNSKDSNYVQILIKNTKRNLCFGLWCVHIAQLIIRMVYIYYRLPWNYVTSLGILQRLINNE